VAALLEAEDPRAGTAGIPSSDPLTQGLYGPSAGPVRFSEGNASTTGEMIKSRMPDLVKGAGMAYKGGNKPLDNHTDILTRSSQAALDLRMATYQGFQSKSATVASLNQGWLNDFGALKTALTMPSVMEQVGQLVSQLPGGGDALKSWTAGNLGIGSVD
jgi:hypothetical protein